MSAKSRAKQEQQEQKERIARDHARVMREEATMPVLGLHECTASYGRIAIPEGMAWINTKIVASDQVRFLYVNVHGCNAEAVRTVLQAIDAGEVQRRNLEQYLRILRASSRDLDVCDAFPYQAQPRLGLRARAATETR